MHRRVPALILAIVLLATLPGVVIWRLSHPQTVRVPPEQPAVARVIAGDGSAGTVDGPAARARFSGPFGVAVAPDGTIYVSDAGSAHRIRRIAQDGTVTTVAGSRRGFADGTGSAARFDTPSALAVSGDGSVFVADTGNNVIRRIDPAGEATIVAGDGTAGYRDGPASQARFAGPIGIAVDRAERIIVADTYNDRIRAISADGEVTTLAGSGAVGAQDGEGPDASFDTPSGVAVDEAGIVYVADTGNGLVRRVAVDGFVTTVGSVASDGIWAQGVASPIGIAVSPSRYLYVTDRRGRIVEIAPDGRERTLAGSIPGFADGPGPEARFRNPTGIALVREGQLVIADAGNALVRELASPALLSFRAPGAPRIEPAFDAEAFGWLPLLWPVEPMGGAHEIAGTFGEARGDPGGSGYDRFHAGVDVREPAGALVLAVRDGIVQFPTSTGGFGTLGEWISVGPLTYVHVRVGRDAAGNLVDPSRFAPVYGEDGSLARVRVKRGASFTTGDVIGTVNAFNHVHLNVGWTGEERNPLLFRWPGIRDTVPPTIPPNGIRLYDESGNAFGRRRRNRLLVHGRVAITVEAWDRMDDSPKRRRLGVYRIGYEILRANGSRADGAAAPSPSWNTIEFDRLVPDPDAPRIVYAQGSGIPFYGNRVTRFLYNVTNTFRDGVVKVGAWDTTMLAPGDYVVRVTVADAAGNEARTNTDVPVTVLPAAAQR